MMSTGLQEVEKDYAKMPDERSPQSLRLVLLSKKDKFANGQELTKEEERIFWREVRDAKSKEVRSWVDHGVF